MRFAIDATPIVPDRKGVGIFLENVIDHIYRRSGSDSPLVYVGRSFYPEAQRRWPFLALRPICSRPSFLWEQYGLPLRVRRDGISVLFTGRERTFLEPNCRTLAYLFEIPDYREENILRNGAGWYQKFSIKLSRKRFVQATRSVTKFIASSIFTQNDLEFRYGVPKTRISLVYPGVDSRFHPAPSLQWRYQIRNRFANGRKYVLHFATGDFRENTQIALRAFKDALEMILEDIQLLLVGVDYRQRLGLDRMVARYGLKDHVSTAGFLSGDDLIMAYQGADAYLDPTRYEGFGFQNLEAMACGVPVISSSVTSVPEVVGDAGLLFSPDDIDGFSSGLKTILNNSDFSEELKEKGLERAKQFTWEKSVGRILSIIQDEMRN